MATLQTVAMKLKERRESIEARISKSQQERDTSFSVVQKCLLNLRSNSQLAAHNQVELGKLKVELRELEDELVRALSVKTRKEAKRMTVVENLSDTRAKVDELQKIVRDQAARKEEYSAILSQQSTTLAESEEKSSEAVKHREEIQQACEWFNKVLGFRIDGGHGVKFSFTSIDRKCPAEEYFFTIRHANNEYNLIECTPLLKDTEELVTELNKSNDLFKFVKTMRNKFFVTSSGTVSQFIYEDQDCTSVSTSAPMSTCSVDSRSQSPLPLKEVNTNVTQAYPQKGLKSSLLSPMSYRRSPRLQAKKPREG